MKRFRAVWGWLREGRMCRRCKIERTYHHVIDELCTTCWLVAVLKGSGLLP